MNDFLGNLAAKNMNAAPRLEPRPLSPFEPLSAWNGNAFTSRLLDAPFETSGEREAEPSAPRTRERAVYPAAQREPVVREPAARHDEKQPRAQGSNPISFPPLVAPLQPISSEIHSTPETHARHAEWQAHETAASPPLTHPTPTEILRVERMIVETEHQVTKAPPLDDARTLARAQPAVPRPKNISRETTEREARPLPSAVITPLLAPMLPAQPVATPRTVTAPTEPAPPTIHVTIGRVEVRAALPNKPAQRETRPAPMSSLEEYLRGREKR